MKIWTLIAAVGLAMLGSGPGFAQNAYIANYDDGTVSVIDTTKDKVIATVPVGRFPEYVAVSPDGATAYTLSDSGIVVIDTKKNNVTATISPPPAIPPTIPLRSMCSPGDIAGCPTSLAIPLLNGSKLYVGGDPAWVIDTKTNIATSLPFATSVLGVSPDGTQLYTTYAVNNDGAYNDAYYLKIISTTNYQVINSILLFSSPFRISYCCDTTQIVAKTDGTKVYISAFDDYAGTPSVFEADLTNNSATIVSSQTDTGETLSLNGTTLYVGDDLDEPCAVVGFNLATNQISGCVRFPPLIIYTFTEGVSLTPDGSKLYVASSNGIYFANQTSPIGGVFVINTATNSIITTIVVGNNPISLGQFIQPPQIFVGTPGKNNCYDKSIKALTRNYSDMLGAAAALGFDSVALLQNALTGFCAQPTS